EATSALDPQTTKSILALLTEIKEKMGLTILLITHEMSVVQEICRYVLVLEKGLLMEQGTVEELFHAPKTEATKRLLVNQGATVLRTTGGRTIRLSFNEDSANEPVIGNAILQFRMPLNILFANMKELNGVPNGQMIVQLPDNEAVAEQMIAYFQEKNVGVEAWTENVG
ncbi:MAG: methionine ABC transporter ATP-binding protein, partial [Lachnospiraceae bacterium]|nr:methionine ABC transporter ATP-binding protein [Lachnospiraceae bacterium]